MVKRYGCAGILLFAMGLFPLLAQDNAVAKEMAIKIADRIVASTVYEFKDVKTGKVYTSLDNVSLNPDMSVNSKYLNWHYTNGVTNMALMELGDKIQNRRYLTEAVFGVVEVFRRDDRIELDLVEVSDLYFIAFLEEEVRGGVDQETF